MTPDPARLVGACVRAVGVFTGLVSLAAVSLADYLAPEADDVPPEGRTSDLLGAEHLSVHDGQGQPDTDEAEDG